MFGKILGSVTDTIQDFAGDPVGTTANIVLQPVSDTVEIFEGLSEGELREKAAIRLGADIVSGMTLSAVIEVLTDE